MNNRQQGPWKPFQWLFTTVPQYLNIEATIKLLLLLHKNRHLGYLQQLSDKNPSVMPTSQTGKEAQKS